MSFCEFQSNSSYVEAFLTNEIGRGGGHKYLDLLWRLVSFLQCHFTNDCQLCIVFVCIASKTD